MPKRHLAAIVVALTVAVGLPAAAPAASHRTVCEKAWTARQQVIARHGGRAPGRNICRLGIRHSTGRVEDATYAQKRRYLTQLRKLVEPMPFLSVRAGSPFQRPAGTATASYAPAGLAACIVHHESGGDPGAANGQYSGIAQWSPEAWGRMGGTRFASSPTGATYQQQLQVLNDGLARFGCRDWCPYDPC